MVRSWTVAKVPLPLAVFFDASILCQLPADLSNSDLARLLEIGKEAKIETVVPEIAKREWIFFHQQAAKRKHDAMASAAKYLGQYRSKPLGIETISAEELARDVERTLNDRFKAAGFVEIRTVGIGVADLVDLAIRQIKPFKNGDRGFRDTLIALSIAEYAQKFKGHRIFVVANDEIFSTPEVKRLWDAAGVIPTVARTLRDAATQLAETLADAGDKLLDQQAEAIKAFLNTRTDQIFERVKTADVSTEFIRTGGLTDGDPAFFGSLEKVRQIRPVEITRVSVGHVLGEMESKKGHVPITFQVKIAFDITATGVNSLRNMLDALTGGRGPRVRLSGEGPSEFVTTVSWTPPASEDLTVEREITLEGWVIEQARAYSDLTIDKISTW
jgi:hypothetical protein